MRKIRTILAALAVAGIAFVPVAANATASIPASPQRIVDGDGVDLPILDMGHGFPVITTSASGGTIYTKHLDSAGTAFELESPDGLCLTNNSGNLNAVYEEACVMTNVSTLWTYAPNDIISSVQVTQGGMTGNMTLTGTNCTQTGVPFRDIGGVPLGCRNQFTHPV